MKPIALVDLDDTLFQTKRKVPDIAESDLVLASRANNGSHSYMTRTQAAFAEWLLASTEAIPVTARGSEALSRVTIPFSSYAIVSNGAVILNKAGKPDEEWHEVVSGQLRPLAGYFAELLAAGNAKADQVGVSIRCWSVMEGDLATYVVFKENDGDGSRLQEIAPIVETEGWVRHHNGNNLALIPPVISKRLASEFLLKRLREEQPDRPVIGYGDSVSDFSYLSLCDWWGAPGKSQMTALVVSAASA
ncbi:hydroxymethylpyrimidine pyrophosphatase-like HAD family hydrolase [Sinorhizobium kostiense]|uniref:Hydroxymethylpyrimidine pyrophosphatase-like HAD family hydrolase n=1 Tax=Sinorhizobium kostiense TaxID=76747 RepID=A0ABS4QXF8_9HYPH|nr:hypothetical protein [Sinorhizobium kostiense]MBP2235338.1 hydroxymethylpyrimidine pyrophosphatase-like HAD family hydrolase [Sinorhizobium kostiense]